MHAEFKNCIQSVIWITQCIPKSMQSATRLLAVLGMMANFSRRRALMTLHGYELVLDEEI